jgi:hypothetical protein
MKWDAGRCTQVLESCLWIRHNRNLTLLHMMSSALIVFVLTGISCHYVNFHLLMKIAACPLSLVQGGTNVIKCMTISSCFNSTSAWYIMLLVFHVEKDSALLCSDPTEFPASPPRTREDFWHVWYWLMCQASLPSGRFLHLIEASRDGEYKKKPHTEITQSRTKVCDPKHLQSGNWSTGMPSQSNRE